MARVPQTFVTDAQLQALVSVADTGSFTAAAKQLGMSQSAVSHALAALSDVLGMPLVRRTARGVQLTELGIRAVPPAREVLRLKALIVQDAAAARRLQHGTVRVGSFGISASRRLLPPLVDAFTRRHPNLEVLLSEGSDEQVEQWIRDGTVDVGFVTLPSDEFDTMPIVEDEMLVLMPAGHPLAKAPRITAADLGRYPFIESIAGNAHIIADLMGEHTLDVRHRMRDVDTILDMICRGMGISIQPELTLPDQMPSCAVARSLSPVCKRQVALGVRRHREASLSTQAFLKVAASLPRGEVSRRSSAK